MKMTNLLSISVALILAAAAPRHLNPQIKARRRLLVRPPNPAKLPTRLLKAIFPPTAHSPKFKSV